MTTTVPTITPDGPGTDQGPTRIIGGGGDDSGPGPEVMDADTLIGNDVINLQDDKLGTIEAIMLDVAHGQVAYAVLGFGGFLGIGEKRFAVPWRALVLDANRQCFILDVPKDRLERAPGFDKDQWPSMADERWATEIHDYYGTPVYWQV